PPGRGPGGPRRCPGRLLELRHPRGAPGPSRVARELNYTRVIAEEEAPTYPAEHMFERRVLGVDPGTAAVGLAVIDGERRPVIVWAQTLRTPSGLAQELRLHRLYTGIQEAIRIHQPSVMALERLMWGTTTASATGVARATGLAILAAALAG